MDAIVFSLYLIAAFCIFTAVILAFNKGNGNGHR